MTALLIILGIIAFFIVLLSIKVIVTVHYEDDIELSVKWLFLNLKLLPKQKKDKKPKKEKKPKEEKSKEESEIVKEPKKKENMFVNFYNNRGVEGVIQLLKDAAKAIGGLFKRIGKSFVFEELFVSLTVGKGDSADTAVKYGETCAAVFPAAGLIVSNMRVKKHSIEVHPDFIYGKNEAKLHTLISVRPIKLINSVIIVLFELLFKVVIKLLMHSEAQEPEVEKHLINNKKS